MKAFTCKLPFCIVVLFIILNHKVCLIIFPICAYLNKKVTSNGYLHVNSANRIKVNELTTLYLKSIMSTYCGLSKWCVNSWFLSHLQDLI